MSGYGQGAEAVPARRMMAHILHALAAIGWHFAFASDLSKKGYDKDTLYFKPGPPRQRYFFPVSFNESDKIRLIDSPNPEVTTAFQAAVSVSGRVGALLTLHMSSSCFAPWLTGRVGRLGYRTSKRKSRSASK